MKDSFRSRMAQAEADRAEWNRLKRLAEDVFHEVEHYGRAAHRVYTELGRDGAATFEYFLRKLERSANKYKDRAATDRRTPNKNGTTTETETNKKSSIMTQSDGNTRTLVRSVKAIRKRYNPMKLLKSSINYTEQCLGMCGTSAPYNVVNKHLISEYGLNGGYIGICQDSTTTVKATPMHCIDLSTYIGATKDNAGNYGPISLATNDHVRARLWQWTQDNKWVHLFPTDGSKEARWYVNEPRSGTQLDQAGTKVFRKGISIDFTVYGCKKMATEYDIRVIKVMDPKMCPDYDQTLNDTGSDHLSTYRQNWQNLVRAYTVNPMLKGIEPGPKPVKPWFKTIAKKVVRLGEQTSDVDKLLSVQGRIYVGLNEVNNLAWDNKGFLVQDGASAYDNVFTVDEQNPVANMKEKPYYTSRYYLLIRALSPVDVNAVTASNQDGVNGGGYKAFENAGITTTDYCPSYDLAVRTHWLTVNANS